MADTSSPNSAADDDLKKHAMRVFKEATKDCADIVFEIKFDMIRDYESLHQCAVGLFKSIANTGLVDFPEELKALSEAAILSDVAVHTIVIGEYFTARKTKAALKAFQHMIATGVAPKSCSYSLLITALALDFSDPNFLVNAKKYFMEMLVKGFKPNSGSYMLVLDAISCRESEGKAREFLDQIKAKGFVPARNLYQFEVGHAIEAMSAMKMYDDLEDSITDEDMQKVFSEWRTNHDLLTKESMKMYTALIEDDNVEQVMEIFRVNAERGILPIVVVHTCVIEAYFSFGKTKAALEAYQGMLAAGVAPNCYTYTVLIKGLTADPNFIGDAKKCLLDMMDRGMRPNAATYTAVLEGFARKEDKAAEEEGKELVKVMIRKGHGPKAKAMMEVLKGSPTPLIRRVLDITFSKLKA
ncbi:pentatricopeptide repeat-containing protein At5g61990, mitochondrial-like [Rosa rugosa]|uniref:pentatricopeptide repeat-containing protein At5g61990, mitochondrial-like n=1 Tax=Rosa rugosa TaxID=74645 RepID=UPI002B407E06|nr:pentatricopeptide repeat-containing protein At5g61990, mitochondrial-like [Rosa rugosa]